jgi:hypothetical protein
MGIGHFPSFARPIAFLGQGVRLFRTGTLPHPTLGPGSSSATRFTRVSSASCFPDEWKEADRIAHCLTLEHVRA